MLGIYTLESGQYVERDSSPTFAPVRVAEIPQFVKESRTIGEIACTRAFRTWVRQQVESSG